MPHRFTAHSFATLAVTTFTGLTLSTSALAQTAEMDAEMQERGMQSADPQDAPTPAQVDAPPVMDGTPVMEETPTEDATALPATPDPVTSPEMDGVDMPVTYDPLVADPVMSEPVGDVTTVTVACPEGTTAQNDGTCMMDGDPSPAENLMSSEDTLPAE